MPRNPLKVFLPFTCEPSDECHRRDLEGDDAERDESAEVGIGEQAVSSSANSNTTMLGRGQPRAAVEGQCIADSTAAVFIAVWCAAGGVSVKNIFR